MKDFMPSVGLVMFLGCFSFIIVPDSDPPGPREKHAAHSDSLPTIVIDPGHGGKDEGAASSGLAEKEMTLDLAMRLEKVLRSFNLPTVLTRRDDRFTSLADRVKIANKIDHAIFVSLHFNHANDAAAGGAETFYADEKLPLAEDWTWIGLFGREEPGADLDTGETLAGYIQASLVSRMEATNRGIKSKAFYVVRHTRCPAALVEAGFLSNPLENLMLRDEDYRQRLANSIAEGVLTYVRTLRPAPPPTGLASTRKD